MTDHTHYGEGMVRASVIAREFGFSSRHWIRLAADGKIPCAYQPSGPRGHWLFDMDAFRIWYAGRQAKEDHSWQRNIKGAAYGGPELSVTARNSGKALRQEIDEWLKSASPNGSKTSKRSPGAVVHEFPSGRR